VTATPWADTAALYSAATDNGYGLNTLIEQPTIMGVTQNTMSAAGADIWDRGAPVEVTLSSGALSAREEEAVLNGANLAAIGDGMPTNWEIFQFARAELTGENTYALSHRLRGQAGSEQEIRDWPAGSYVVLIDASFAQIDHPLAARGLARHYRIGPAGRSFDDPSYDHKVLAFEGRGLRPYAPVHLRSTGSLGQDVTLEWTRRTRVDGDSWQGIEVPLGEAQERYLIRILKDGALLREEITTAPQFTYTAAAQSLDGASGSLDLQIAQLSDSFGAGPSLRSVLHG